MPETGPIDTLFPYGDIRRMVKHNHMQIMALFQVYLGSPHDSRQAIRSGPGNVNKLISGESATVDAPTGP